MLEQIPPELRNAGPGIAGSALALFFMRRPMLVMCGIFIGGCIISFYGTTWVATQLEMERADGLVGFLLGLFGMALIGKVHDSIEAINTADVWKAVIEAIRKKLGV